MAEDTGCAVLFGEEVILDGHDTTAEEDRLLAAGKWKPTKRGTLSAEQLLERAGRWYQAGADGVHLFNISDRSVLKTIGTATP